mgnify:CR=1 FL=1
MLFSAAEVICLEDTLRQVEVSDTVYGLEPTEWTEAWLKVGANLGEASEVIFSARECWAIVRLLSVNARQGQEAVGLHIKQLLYKQLAHPGFLDSFLDAEEVEYARTSESPAEGEAKPDADSSTSEAL